MYEYLFVPIPTNNTFAFSETKDLENLQTAVNEYAQLGWRLNQMLHPSSGGSLVPDRYLLIFERPKASSL